jgi:serine/threonine protein kinase
MLTVNPVQRITADAALAHPWLRRHCQHAVPTNSSRTLSPDTPSLSCDTGRGPWESASEPEGPLINDTLLLEMGSLSFSIAKKDSPFGEEGQKRACQRRRAADAVFRRESGMRSRASSEAGDDADEPEQPETPGQAERMRRPNSLDSDNGGMLVNLHDLM